METPGPAADHEYQVLAASPRTTRQGQTKPNQRLPQAHMYPHALVQISCVSWFPLRSTDQPHGSAQREVEIPRPGAFTVHLWDLPWAPPLSLGALGWESARPPWPSPSPFPEKNPKSPLEKDPPISWMGILTYLLPSYLGGPHAPHQELPWRGHGGFEVAERTSFLLILWRATIRARSPPHTNLRPAVPEGQPSTPSRFPHCGAEGGHDRPQPPNP